MPVPKRWPERVVTNTSLETKQQIQALADKMKVSDAEIVRRILEKSLPEMLNDGQPIDL